jgi:hypothetical protein
MIVCFNCTAEIKDELDRLLEIGSYRDYGEAIAAAVRNQLLMEQEVAEKGAIVIGGPTPAAAPHREVAKDVRPSEPVAKAKVTASPSKPTPRRKEVGAAKSSRNGTIVQPGPAVPPTVPALFQKEAFPEEAPGGLADLPTDMWAPGQTVPLDRWVLGQQNRLLPAKVNARAIIRIFVESPGGLPISSTAESIAAEAAVLGDYLSAIDDARKVSRDDALATAFPTSGEDADKSRIRYANQFVVYQNSRGELSGLMVDLKLVNVVQQRKQRLIMPTRIAWEFARLPNPVLDGAINGHTEKFTADERSLLLQHIASSVPVEDFAYRAVLKAVQAGSNTPDTIDAALKTYVAEDRAEKLSQSFLASQRSGAISRMSDLGLIARQRNGVRVSYAVTEEGRTFLEATKK